ncbi:MAG: hypothetical protein EOP84_01790 [Verrucomicrobiaceae bacterium]|nr:MAG: hypothetical protein EOP84_01790 [Verrucomicrobiaceae bacterium]
MGGAEGGGFLALHEEAEGAPPAGDLEDGLGDEAAVALAPLRVFLEGGGQLTLPTAAAVKKGRGFYRQGAKVEES